LTKLLQSPYPPAQPDSARPPWRPTWSRHAGAEDAVLARGGAFDEIADQDCDLLGGLFGRRDEDVLRVHPTHDASPQIQDDDGDHGRVEVDADGEPGIRDELEEGAGPTASNVLHSGCADLSLDQQLVDDDGHRLRS